MEKLRRLRQFIVETISELKKTTWPGRKEVYGTTLVVIIAVIVTAAFLFVVDMILDAGMKNLFEALG